MLVLMALLIKPAAAGIASPPCMPFAQFPVIFAMGVAGGACLGFTAAAFFVTAGKADQ